MAQNQIWFNESEMDKALLSINKSYKEILGRETPDVVMPLGAPNQYEEEIRYGSAESDLFYNLKYGNNVSDTVVLIPEGMEIEDRESVQELRYMGVEFQETDDLYTTFDDWKSAEDITSNGDIIHGHTSDYHGIKAHLTGWSLIDLLEDRNVNTFAQETRKRQRENIWKHNAIIQTFDLSRQLYKVVRDRSDL